MIYLENLFIYLFRKCHEKCNEIKSSQQWNNAMKKNQ